MGIEYTVPNLFKGDFGGAPAAASQVGGLEAQDMRILAEQALDGPAQRARSLSVDDPDLGDPSPPAFLQVLRDEVLDLLRPESMEVEHSVYRDLHGIISTHRHILLELATVDQPPNFLIQTAVVKI